MFSKGQNVCCQMSLSRRCLLQSKSRQNVHARTPTLYQSHQIVTFGQSTSFLPSVSEQDSYRYSVHSIYCNFHQFYEFVSVPLFSRKICTLLNSLAPNFYIGSFIYNNKKLCDSFVTSRWRATRIFFLLIVNICLFVSKQTNQQTILSL